MIDKTETTLEKVMETSTIVKIKKQATHMRDTKTQSVKNHSCDQIFTECDNLNAEIDNIRSGLEDALRNVDMINSAGSIEHEGKVD